MLDSQGTLPELSLFDPIMNKVDVPVTNKEKVMKVKTTCPVIFPAQNEDLSKFEDEPIHKALMCFLEQKLI